MTNGPDPEETQPFRSPTPPASGWTPPHPPPTQPLPPAAQPSPGFPPGWLPAYGAALPGSRDHSGATTALVLGIIALAGLVLTPFCCITLPAVLCAPFAWYVGSRALRDMADAPGVYGNRSSARTGQVMGIVTTAFGVIAVLAVVAIFVVAGWNSYSLV